jgi:hypothetical protein
MIYSACRKNILALVLITFYMTIGNYTQNYNQVKEMHGLAPLLACH